MEFSLYCELLLADQTCGRCFSQFEERLVQRSGLGVDRILFGFTVFAQVFCAVELVLKGGPVCFLVAVFLFENRI